MVNEQRRTATAWALSLLNTPYLWGGNDGSWGVDCSGFVGAVLRKAGIVGEKFDTTAHGYRDMFVDQGKKVSKAKEGCLIFYGKEAGKISHVMYCLNKRVVIGAVRGNSQVTTIEIAKERDAKVDFEPLGYRSDIIGIVDPFMDGCTCDT